MLTSLVPYLFSDIDIIIMMYTGILVSLLSPSICTQSLVIYYAPDDVSKNPSLFYFSLTLLSFAPSLSPSTLRLRNTARYISNDRICT